MRRYFVFMLSLCFIILSLSGCVWLCRYDGTALGLCKFVSGDAPSSDWSVYVFEADDGQEYEYTGSSGDIGVFRSSESDSIYDGGFLSIRYDSRDPARNIAEGVYQNGITLCTMFFAIGVIGVAVFRKKGVFLGGMLF